MSRDVTLRTSARNFCLRAPLELTLEEFLRTKRIPPNLFQCYIKKQGAVEPIPLHTQIITIPNDFDIVLQCIRNIDLKHVLPQKTFFKKTENPVTAIRVLNLSKEGCTQTINEINSVQAKKTVKSKINEFFNSTSNEELVLVGISGGGDSNTLAEGLKAVSEKSSAKKFIFFTIIFPPLWPQSAADRASELCNGIGEKHEVYDSKGLENLLNMKVGIDKCYEEFRKQFGNDTSHFFGTFLISLVARALCRKYRTSEYILGFNREDLLAELLFSLMNGQKPLAFPIRKFGEIRLLMPLWEIPKLILDACYTDYSLSNYEERDNESTYQRNIIYYLAHTLEDAYDNLGLSIMYGIKKLFTDNWAELEQDRELDLYISRYADQTKNEEVKNFLKKYFKMADNS